MDIIRDLRTGLFDVLVGINLLREGLDLPEVSLVAILDADKEGFLRSTRSLIQTFGRAARNVHGRIIMYADEITRSMQQAIDETLRRCRIQEAYNRKHRITPETIQKEITDIFESVYEADYVTVDKVEESLEPYREQDDIEDLMIKLEKEMKLAADELAFERAAEIRDQIKQLKKILLFEF
jgi:excinuclease ABC subunit B